jgi:hypothetical protein
MTREQYFALKEELKALALQIKKLKPTYRNIAQPDFSNFERQYGSRQAYFSGAIKSSTWELIQKDWNEKYNTQNSMFTSLYTMIRDFRHKHIVYCFARGKIYSQIEQKVRKGHEPSKYELQRLMKLYEVEEPLTVEASK